jgi:hypothetical protein
MSCRACHPPPGKAVGNLANAPCAPTTPTYAFVEARIAERAGSDDDGTGPGWAAPGTATAAWHGGARDGGRGPLGCGLAWGDDGGGAFNAAASAVRAPDLRSARSDCSSCGSAPSVAASPAAASPGGSSTPRSQTLAAASRPALQLAPPSAAGLPAMGSGGPSTPQADGDTVPAAATAALDRQPSSATSFYTARSHVAEALTPLSSKRTPDAGLLAVESPGAPSEATGFFTARSAISAQTAEDVYLCVPALPVSHPFLHRGSRVRVQGLGTGPGCLATPPSI